MLSLILGIVAVLVSVCIVDAIVIVPAYHFGVHERLGGRTGKIYYEGFGLKLPFIDKVELISTELAEIDVQAFFTTGGKVDGGAGKSAGKSADNDDSDDKLQVELTGSIQYRPSSHVKDQDGRNVFISVSDEIIKSGVADMLKDMLGGLGGIYQAEDFIRNRQAFGDLVNQILKFATPFHLRHINDGSCDAEGCKHKNVKNIPREDLIGFYNVHWEKIREERIAKAEKDKERRCRSNSDNRETPEEEAERLLEDMSPTEKRYGINIEAFALEKLDFSDDVKKAFEVRRAAKERQKGFAVKMEMANEVMKLSGASAQEALDAADVSLIPEVARNKRVISVQGKAGVLGGILSKFGSDNSSTRRQQ